VQVAWLRLARPGRTFAVDTAVVERLAGQQVNRRGRRKPSRMWMWSDSEYLILECSTFRSSPLSLSLIPGCSQFGLLPSILHSA
jgi:hypothetical protein